MPGIHTNPSDVIDNSALATAWHIAGLPRVARECVPIATRLTTLFATLKCSEGFAKRKKGITAEICRGRKCVERFHPNTWRFEGNWITSPYCCWRGYDVMLNNILMAEIMPIVEEFDEQTNDDTVYEFRLQAAANNFIEAASRLPRASGCFPPCGFQAQGAVYNCVTCQYDSCEFPLDCPVKEITVHENNRTQMWCKVPFPLPTGAEIMWRYAMEKTMLMDRFDEVTVGLDPLYFISSARPEHSGTYQCEIFSQEHSLVRIYYYLTVVPLAQLGHAELQDVFEQALLPGGQFPPLSHKDPFTLWVPSPALLTTCLTSMFLLVFLMLGVLYLLSNQIGTNHSDPAQETKSTQKKKYLIHC